MINALWITAVGMGLVFIAILLLWGLMALIVRLTAEKPAKPGDLVAAMAFEEPAPQPEDDGDFRRRAAVAAVGVALALQQKPPVGSGVSADQGSTLNAWQAVNRASQLQQRSQAIRKQVLRSTTTR